MVLVLLVPLLRHHTALVLIGALAAVCVALAVVGMLRREPDASN